MKQTKLFHSISEMFFIFLKRKNSLRKTFLLQCVRSGTQQAGRKGRNFGAKLTHFFGFWLDVSFFSHVKEHRSRFWLDVSLFFFSRVKTIVHSSDWLRTHLCIKIYNTTFWWVFLSMYIINSYTKGTCLEQASWLWHQSPSLPYRSPILLSKILFWANSVL